MARSLWYCEYASLQYTQWTNYLAVIQPSLTFALIDAVFAAVLIPLLIALFFFSTPKSRRMLIFFLNAASIILGIGEGILLVCIEVHDILNPITVSPPALITTWFIISLYTPLLVESILVLRLIAVFPPRISGRRTLWLVLVFPALIKMARIISLSMMTAKWVALSNVVHDTVAAGREIWSDTPYAKLVWMLQLFDNTYCSTIFIYRLKRRGPQPSEGVYKGSSIVTRLRGLFLISVSNFVFPCLFSLVQIVLIFRNPNYMNIAWFLDCCYLMIVNNYITIVGVVFATIWSSGSTWATSNGLDSDRILGPLTFMNTPSDGTPLPHLRHDRHTDTFESSTPGVRTIPDFPHDLEEQAAADEEKLSKADHVFSPPTFHHTSDESISADDISSAATTEPKSRSQYTNHWQR